MTNTAITGLNTSTHLTKTHSSESQGQEEVQCSMRVCLQTYATTTLSNLHVAEL